MTTDYTPITAEVRSHYLYVRSGKWLNNPAPFEEEFDRWFQKVKAEAWDEGFHATRLGDYDHFLRDYPEADENPYL